MTDRRFVVVGVGAIGGAVAAGLHRSGSSVVGIARGPHLEMIRRNGIVVCTPAESFTVPLDVRPTLVDAGIGETDILVLCVKTQDTAPVLQELALLGVNPAIVCLQNGVENERLALRLFDNVYGGVIAVPAAHLEPGVVAIYCGPLWGVIEVGRYPMGVDTLCRDLAEALGAAGFAAPVSERIAAGKYGKLLWNVGNAARAAFSDERLVAQYRALSQDEARDCFAAAGIECDQEAGDDPLVAHNLQRLPVDGQRHPGGSTWQSLSRGAGHVETDYLNGEVALLGRLHGIATPVNAALCAVVRLMVAGGTAPGEFDPATFERMLSTRRG